MTLLFFWPQLVDNKVLYWGDIGLYFAPMQEFLHQNLRAGRIPLWNPLILCGTPYVGNPQTWPLYPVTALLGGMSAPQFINWTIGFHVWFAALGTYFFLRQALGRSAAASLFGGVVFAFGGQLVSKEQFPNMVQSASYLPWTLWFVFRLMTLRRWGDALRLGLILGLQLLAAHAQMTMLTLYLNIAYALFVLASEHRNGRRLRIARFLMQLAAAAIIAVGLAAGQILPTVELYRDAWRQRLSFSVVDRFYLPLNQLGNFVLPTLHGHPIRGDFAARGNFWETCCYIGWTAALLSIFGIIMAFRSPRERVLRFWVGGFAIGILMAVGGQTWHGAPAVNGLYWIAYHLLPGFRNFHDPARCLLWSAFAAAVLAAGGLDSLLRSKPDTFLARLLPIGLTALCFFELAHFGRALYPLADPSGIHPVPPLVATVENSAAFRAHQARFLAPDSARVWQRFTGHRSYRQASRDYQSLWADTLTPNLMMPYGLPDAGGYEPVTRRDAQTVVGATMQAFGPEATADQRAVATTWAGLLGVSAIVTLRVHSPETALHGLKPVSSAETLSPLGRSGDSARTFLSENERWQPRARIMTDFRSVPSDRTALALWNEALLQPKTIDLRRTVIVTGPIPFAPAPWHLIAADIIRDEPDRVEVRATTTVPALLVLADTGHPGWQVTVDGKSSALLSADLFLRAVPLPAAGAHEVVFSYCPTSYRLGFYLTLLTTAVLTICGTRAATSSWKKLGDRAGVSASSRV